MKKFLLRLWKEKIGQDTTEYALLLLLLALAAITSMKTLANGIQNAYTNTGNAITTGGGGGGSNSGGSNNGGRNNGGRNDGGFFF